MQYSDGTCMHCNVTQDRGEWYCVDCDRYLDELPEEFPKPMDSEQRGPLHAADLTAAGAGGDTGMKEMDQDLRPRNEGEPETGIGFRDRIREAYGMGSGEEAPWNALWELATTVDAPCANNAFAHPEAAGGGTIVVLGSETDYGGWNECEPVNDDSVGVPVEMTTQRQSRTREEWLRRLLLGLEQQQNEL